MIVRISGEGQYTLSDEDVRRVNELEQVVVRIAESGREDGFDDALRAVLSYVREHGRELPDDALEPSDVILPPADVSYAEASRDFTGEGLIPD